MALFTVAGRRVVITREVVAAALRGVTPEPIQKHAVEIEGRLFPVVQALEAASGVPRGNTRSANARRIFTALGMRLVQFGPGYAAPAAAAGAPTNLELDTAIAEHAQTTSYGDRPASEVVAIVSLDNDGKLEQRPGGGWARMHRQPAHTVAGFNPAHVPPQPGVYAFYRDGKPVYVGRAIASGGLQRRLKTQHLKTGIDLSWSAFRRNVAEYLGIAPSTLTRRRPPQLAEEQVAPVNDWIAACELRWIACATKQEAADLEDRLKAEAKPPLTKR